MLGKHVGIKYSQTSFSPDNAIVLEQSEELSVNKSEYKLPSIEMLEKVTSTIDLTVNNQINDANVMLLNFSQ